ncbi:MAG: type I secretion system permease/ATPase [Rhodospirillaceae bacterium]|jgi:ATP-binding cassette subfamily C protein|nr:type I secretion system permease/ATPase [Rhodospirillaceae bacterium]MBT5457212.1 type I secretion system permease/ATPase [Rhodospirillaceae bacterium]
MAVRDQDILRETLRSSAMGILCAALFGLFVNLLQLVVPLYMLQIYDRVIVSHSMDTLLMLTLVALGCLVFLASMDFIRSNVFIVIGERLARRLSGPTIQAAVTRSLSAGAAQSARAIRDLHELRQFVTAGPISLPFDAAFAPLFLLILFMMHPAYGLVASGAVVILIVLSAAMEFFVRRRSQAANEAAAQSHAEVGTAVRHAELIESMGMLGAVMGRWQAGQDRALRLVGSSNTLARMITAASQSIRMGLQIIMLGTGASLVIDGAVSAGTIVASTIIMTRLLLPFEQIMEGWRSWAEALASYQRLKALLGEVGADRQGTPVDVMSGKVAVEGLSFVPPGEDKPVLRNVSFELEAGEMLSIVGPSGAGKSTLARLLVGIWAPSAGGIFLDGQNVFNWERTSFGAATGFLPQSPALLDATISENIARLTETEPAAVIDAARRVGAHELIGHFPKGYETPVGSGGFALSGGQRQRIALARAFFGCPRMIVLDEPNSFLDSEGEQALMAAIIGAKEDGATIIVVSHRPAMANISDKVLVLRDGMVDSFGSRESVALSTAKLLPGVSSGSEKIAQFPLARIGQS